MKSLLMEELAILRQAFYSIATGAIVGLSCGLSSWIFLVSLEWATETRLEHPWLLYFLPIAGLIVAWAYRASDPAIDSGNNLILEEIHQPASQIPWPMAPLVAWATVFSHLFGASTGREGTAVQMGGSLADWLAGQIKADGETRRLMLMCGVSGGFGAVFGTPLTGTVFGLEVLSIGRIRHTALLPCFVSSVTGDIFCQWLGIGHENYQIADPLAITPGLLFWLGLMGLAAGLVSMLFIELTHSIAHQSKKRFGTSIFRPFAGGLIIILLVKLCGTSDYLGLSLPLISLSLKAGEVALGAFLLKLIFTSVSLGMGFKGGEVTPLFGIGAALGHVFATVFNLPVPIFAAAGFVAVFAGAANTPVACIILGFELFGSDYGLPIAAATILSYLSSGHRSIYHAQRIDSPKASGLDLNTDMSLKNLNTGRDLLQKKDHE
jgi:H+/Cl- antiporter ClcA